MRKPTIARISIATGTAALCLAVASPAMACIPAESGGPAPAADPLAAAIAKADHDIASQLNRLDGWAAKIAADLNLTSTQHSSFAMDIATAKSDLQAQQTLIAAAMSVADVTADLQSPTVDAANGVVSVDVAITGANDALVNKANSLTALAAKVLTDTGLSAAQKTDVGAAIDAAQIQVQAARVAVNAATTTAAVKAAQESTAVKTALNTLNLRLAIDHADFQIDAVQTKLATWLTQVSTDPSLTAAQIAAATAKIMAAQASLTALRAKVDAATSAGQVASLLRAAHFGDQSWEGDDPAKLVRSDRYAIVVAKREGANCGKGSGNNDPDAVTTQHAIVTAVIKTNTPHTQAPAPQVKSGSQSGSQHGGGSSGGSGSHNSSHGRGGSQHH